jgi:shikimate kinase
MSHLVLIGPRGSGKSSVGQLAARLLGWDFVDTDVLVEARGRTIAEVFAAEGEPGFRALEREVISDLRPADNTVIATGGGAVLDAANRDHLAALGSVIYLHATPECLVARIAGSDRPPLTDADPLEEMRRVLEHREPLYRALADAVLDTETLDPDLAARRLADRVRGPRRGQG